MTVRPFWETVDRDGLQIDWMNALARQYEDFRARYPDDDLMIVFDIDGTILDMRHMIRHVLIDYDRANGSNWFYGLGPEDIDVHENQLEAFLSRRLLPDNTREHILDWYHEHFWSSEAILASHRPYRGVMEVIRWFMLQPRTRIGLNTGRPERIRGDTLESLNTLGSEYRVHFEKDLLEMHPGDPGTDIANHKAVALDRLIARGHRVFAVVDNEPANIESMLRADSSGEILFLHADTIFLSQSAPTSRTVSGDRYDLTSFLSEQNMPDRVSLVWHGVNDETNLHHFIESSIRWCEADVRRDPYGRLVLRADSFEAVPWRRDETPFYLECFLDEVERHGKSVKLDLQEGGETIGRVLETVALFGLEDHRLWFNANIETLGEAGFLRIEEAYPGAVIQCPVDHLGPIARTMPAKARQILRDLECWGISRFSIGWNAPLRQDLFDRIGEWGYHVNLYDVPDLEAFLKAALMLPRSLTADFNFPAWNYFGCGARGTKAPVIPFKR